MALILEQIDLSETSHGTSIAMLDSTEPRKKKNSDIMLCLPPGNGKSSIDSKGCFKGEGKNYPRRVKLLLKSLWMTDTPKKENVDIGFQQHVFWWKKSIKFPTSKLGDVVLQKPCCDCPNFCLETRCYRRWRCSVYTHARSKQITDSHGGVQAFLVGKNLNLHKLQQTQNIQNITGNPSPNQEGKSI